MSFYIVPPYPNGHEYIIFTGSDPTTFSLPDARISPGVSFIFKQQGTGVATISAPFSQTVDGSTTFVLSTQYSDATLFSDGNNWNSATGVLSGSSSVITGAGAPNDSDGRPNGTVYIQTS